MVDRTTSGHKAGRISKGRTVQQMDRTWLRLYQNSDKISAGRTPDSIAGYDNRYDISRTRSKVGYHTVGMEIVRTEHHRKNVKLLG